MMDFIAMLKADPDFSYEVYEESYQSMMKVHEVSYIAGSMHVDLPRCYRNQGYGFHTIKSATDARETDSADDDARRRLHPMLRFTKGDLIFIPEKPGLVGLVDLNDVPQDTRFYSDVNYRYVDLDDNMLKKYGVVEAPPFTFSITKLDDTGAGLIKNDTTRGIYKDFKALGKEEFILKHFF